MAPQQSELNIFVPETADMPEPLDVLDDVETVTQTIMYTLVALGYKVSIDQLDIFNFYVTYTINLLDDTDLANEVGKMYAALAATLNIREFTLKAPLSDAEPHTMQLTLPRPESNEEALGMSIYEWLKSLFDGNNNWRT